MLDANGKYFALNREAVESCTESAREVSDAAQMCLTFKEDYEAVAKIAKGNIKELVDDSTLTLRDYFLNIRQSANRAVEPFFNEIGKLKRANRKRTVLYIALGLIAGLVFSTCFAWFTQPQNYIQLDAQKWRVCTSDLTHAQHERVKNLLSEIEKEKKEAENNRNNAQLLKTILQCHYRV